MTEPRFKARVIRLTPTTQHSFPFGVYMKAPSNLGMILLAIWLVLYGVLSAPLLNVQFNHSGNILAVLAIVTGIVLFVRRA